MKPTDDLRDKVDKAENMEDKKNIIAEKGMELTDEDLEGIAGGLGKKTEGNGLVCPQCERFIPISMYQIMVSSSIFCPACGLRLDIAREESVLSRLQMLDK